MDSMPKNLRPVGELAPAPLSGHAELIRERLAARRQELARYSPQALDLAATALAVAHDAAYRHMRELRGDRDERHRRYQLTGERGLQFEDVACLAFEGELGAAVVLPLLRALAGAIGHDVRPATGEALTQAEAKAQLLLATATLIAALDRFEADGRLDAMERQEASAFLNALEGRVAAMRASLGNDGPGGRPGLQALAGGRG